MPDTVMLNARINKTLKDHGMQVLDAQGMSATSLIRRVFEYMESHQDIPECLKEPAQGKYERRRELLRAAAGALPVPSGYDSLGDKHARVEAKCGDVLL